MFKKIHKFVSLVTWLVYFMGLKCIYNVIFIIYNIGVNFTSVEKYYYTLICIRPWHETVSENIKTWSVIANYSHLHKFTQNGNITNKGSKSNLYFIIWLRIYYFTIKPKVFIMAFAIAHIKFYDTKFAT